MSHIKLLTYKGKNKNTYYGRTNEGGKRKKIPLGHDLAIALQKIREIESTGSILPTKLSHIWDKYSKDYRDGLLARPVSTQKDYERCWKMISSVLADIDLEAIKPSHIKQYMKNRTGRVRANREKALISILFNYAIEYCEYDGLNPTFGLKGFKEKGRDRYIQKWEYEEIYAASSQLLKDTLDLLLYTGQRPSDILDIKFSDIKLHCDISDINLYDNSPVSQQIGSTYAHTIAVQTNKTKKKIEIIVAGDFAPIFDRIIERYKERKVKSIYLISDNKGQKLTIHQLEHHFKKARTKAGYKAYDIQMRDLRSKNACDSTGEEANIRLAHTTQAMTDKYRNKVRSVFVPTLRKIR